MRRYSVFEEYPDVLTVKQVCKALSIGKNTLYELLKNKKIKSLRLGKKYLVPKICLVDYVNSCRE